MFCLPLQLKQIHHKVKLLLKRVVLHLYKDKSQALHTGCHLNRIKNKI